LENKKKKRIAKNATHLSIVALLANNSTPIIRKKYNSCESRSAKSDLQYASSSSSAWFWDLLNAAGGRYTPDILYI
jgi:hypothetical protein